MAKGLLKIKVFMLKTQTEIYRVFNTIYSQDLSYTLFSKKKKSNVVDN